MAGWYISVQHLNPTKFGAICAPINIKVSPSVPNCKQITPVGFGVHQEAATDEVLRIEACVFGARYIRAELDTVFLVIVRIVGWTSGEVLLRTWIYNLIQLSLILCDRCCILRR